MNLHHSLRKITQPFSIPGILLTLLRLCSIPVVPVRLFRNRKELDDSSFFPLIGYSLIIPLSALSKIPLRAEEHIRQIICRVFILKNPPKYHQTVVPNVPSP
jgi:hypothetical protein